MSGAATGVTGLEATHGWFSLPSLTLLLGMNVFSGYPIYKLIEIPDFFSTPDMDDNRHAKTGTFGEELVTSFARGKSFQYIGAVLGRTRDECLVGKTSLMAAFGPDPASGQKLERRMVMHPDASLVDPADTAPAGLDHTFVGTCQKVTMNDIAPRRITEDGLPPIKWALRFTLEMRITNGLFYEWNSGTETESNPKYA